MAPDKILEAMAETYRNRNAVYKDNWRAQANALAAIFPDGITLRTPEDFVHFGFVYMTVAKVTRFANTGMRHGDSVHDVGVYAAMEEAFISAPPEEKP